MVLGCSLVRVAVENCLTSGLSSLRNTCALEHCTRHGHAYVAFPCDGQTYVVRSLYPSRRSVSGFSAWLPPGLDQILATRNGPRYSWCRNPYRRPLALSVCLRLLRVPAFRVLRLAAECRTHFASANRVPRISALESTVLAILGAVNLQYWYCDFTCRSTRPFVPGRKSTTITTSTRLPPGLVSCQSPQVGCLPIASDSPASA